jgi:hypothetical protein
MVTGSVRIVVIVGVLIGAAILGGIIGAGIDFITGDTGWWGVCGLAGLMAGEIAVAVMVEGKGSRANAQP